MVEKSTNVGIEHPLHPLAVKAHTERIERLVWTATGPEPIRKAPKVHLINLVKDGHYCLLDNFVLQGGNAQRSLPTVGLGDIDSPRGLSPIRTTLYSAVQVSQPTVQSGFILWPRETIHTRGRFSL